MRKFFSLFVLLALLACAGPANRTWAAVTDDKAVADFYRGKTVKIIVGFSAGGGYDAYSRLIGRHLQKHIPGNPSIIVENMAGAGSILLANHMFNVAPKDGTVIGNFSGQIILEQIFGNPAVQYDLAKFRYLGVPIGETYLLITTRKSGVTKLEELLGSKAKQITVGGIPGSTVEQGPLLMRDLLGANIKVVSGYKGTSDVRLAMESGEIDGIMNSWESSKVTSLDRIKNGDWQLLAQLGDHPIPDLPVKNVPTIPQIAKTEEQRQLLRFGAAAPNQFGKVYLVSPGTPPERGAALETALTRTFADKELLAEAEKGKLDIDPVSAQHVQKLINDFFGLSPDLKAKLKKILRP
ncbi:MAG TPA: tripartite tricarboxylate transporter substrate-binding protein [Candidatus Binatia bacterium]|nr:tripartite tricarboxylate transporter substrate-binding protein [Candidatus Binatia bacterium]